MRMLLWVGLLFVVLGIVSLLVPIPQTDTAGVKVGNVNIGVQTRHSKRVPPIISAVLIAGGISMIIAGACAGSSQKRT